MSRKDDRTLPFQEQSLDELRAQFVAAALSGLLARYSSPPTDMAEDIARSVHIIADAVLAYHLKR